MLITTNMNEYRISTKDSWSHQSGDIAVFKRTSYGFWKEMDIEFDSFEDAITFCNKFADALGA